MAATDAHSAHSNGSELHTNGGTYQLPPQVHLVQQSNQLRGLFTIIRDKETERSDFVFYADRIIRLLVEEGLNYLPSEEKSVTTPTESEYRGLAFTGKVCGVSIMRAGEAMEKALRDCCRSIRIGKILIQRDERTHLPKLFYSKLPPDIAGRYCLLLDPMLATGGSAVCAIEVLLEAGVAEQNIVFLNLVAAPEGIKTVLTKYPRISIITGEIDLFLNENKYIVPGLGDFGCRYFGTDD